MKLMIWLGIAIGGLAGAWLGSLLDDGNMFGFWSILISGIGSLGGIWAGYQIAKRIAE